MEVNAKRFPVLYGSDKNGKTKMWEIMVMNCGDYSVIYCTYGYINGKKVEAKTSISSGKNKGKRNETTHFQQAVLDAESKWRKKRDTDGYSEQLNETKNELPASSESSGMNANVLPMLAQDYKKNVSKVKFPCFLQPKLDGYRMVYDGSSQRVLSRTGKEYSIIKSTELFNELKSVNLVLDGELYVHDPSFSFENYGILRKQATKQLSDKEQNVLDEIQYHVYDIIDTSLTFAQRLQKLHEVFGSGNFKHIKLVQTIACQNVSDINNFHAQNIQDHYEGSIVRNSESFYKPKFRSHDLLKLKDFDDAEFEIVDYTFEQDTKSDKRLVVWVCKTNDPSHTFRVQSKGTRDQRSILYANGNQFVGKMLSVQFFGYTQDGIPRFPKTLRAGQDSIRIGNDM